MSVKVGWSRTPPDGRRHLHLFELQRVRGGTEGRHLIVGWHRFSRRELEDLRDKGIRVRLRAAGVISFTGDVSPRLFHDVFEDVSVWGLVRNRPRAREVPAT